MTKQVRHDLRCWIIAATLGVLLVIIGIATGAPAAEPGVRTPTAMGSHIPTDPNDPLWLREVQLSGGGFNGAFAEGASTHPVNRAGLSLVTKLGLLAGYHVSDRRTGGLEVGLSSAGKLRLQASAVFWADTPQGGQGTSARVAAGYQGSPGSMAVGVDYMTLMDSWGLWIGIPIR